MAVSALCFSAPTALADDLQSLVNAQRLRSQQFLGQLRGSVDDSKRMVEQMLPAGQSPAMAELAATRTVVFVSRSMPEHVLLPLLAQGAGRRDTVFLYRGWGEAGVDTVFEYVEALLKKLPAAAQQNPPNIMVLPSAFATYRITHVPAVLHQNAGKWYLVQGSLSLDGTLDVIRQRRFDSRLSRQWRVSEPDQAAVMQAMAKKFDWAAEQKRAAEAVKAQMAGSLDLPTASNTSNRLYTPYMTANFDVKSPQGRLIYPAGTRYNVLALDPAGTRSLLVINGQDARQIRYAQQIVQQRPQTVVLYTRLGSLAGAGIQASPINAMLAQRLGVSQVPTYLQQQGVDFRVVTIKPY